MTPPQRSLPARLLMTAVGIGAISAVLFLLLEGACRLFLPQDIRVTSSPSEESLAVKDSLLGYRMRPGVAATLKGPEFTATYRISRQGFRDRRLHSPVCSPDTMRILILGDSFAFGAGGEYDEIWPVLFERELERTGRAVDVVKAGVLGYDTRTETRYLEDLLPAYRPDLVLLTFLPNDLFTNTPESGPLPPPPDAGKPGRSIHLVRLATRAVLSSDRLYCLVYLRTKRKQFFLPGGSERLRDKVAVTRDLLERAHALCRDAGASFAVLSLPQQFQVLAGARDLGGVDIHGVDRALEAAAAESGYPWVRTLPFLIERYRSGGKDLYYPYDGHLTPEGNRAVADRLVEAFRELVPGT